MKKILTFILDCAETAIITGIIILLVWFFILRPFEVSGSSMFPTFQNNEHVFTNIIGMRFEQLKRGDVIVFKSPPEPEKDYIKRIIALPGEKIRIENSAVYINGKPLDESKYIPPSIPTLEGLFMREGEEKQVPIDSYFVMGDNRLESSDSRNWGFVKKDLIVGKSLYVYLPLDKMRLVKNPFYD